jgi:hypothetical protein
MKVFGKEYNLVFPDGYALTFEVLNVNEHIEEWKECTDISYVKYKKIFTTKDGEYIGELQDSYYLKFSNKEDLIRTMPFEVVFFRGKQDKIIHPFILLDKKGIETIRSNFTLDEFKLHRNERIFDKCFFYKFDDGRILCVDKQGTEGELFSDLNDLLAYYSFIEGFDLRVEIEIK